MCSNGSAQRTGILKGASMSRWTVIFALLAMIFAGAPAFARGGQSADDCPPHSKDPDCAGH
jgi:hypothetical protein